MSDIAALVERLIQAGTPPAIAAQVVSESFALGVSSADRPRTSRDVTDEARREKDRIRQKNRRDNLRKSADVHGNPQTSADVPLSKSSLEEEREAPSRDVTPWTPDETDWRDALAKLGEQIANSELLKFRETNRRQPGSRKDSEWRVWVQHAVDYLGSKGKLPASTSKVTGVEDEKFWESAISSWKKFGKWSAAHCGPDPDSAACRCPPAILTKHGLRQEAAE